MTQALSAMPTADACSAPERTAPTCQVTRRNRILGLVLIAGLPALFWTLMIALFAPLVGYAPSLAALVVVAAGIAALLLTVCCALEHD